MSDQDLLGKLNGTDGFVKFNIEKQDLEKLREMIFLNFKKKLQSEGVHFPEAIKNIHMINYHKILKQNPKLDHTSLWPKKNRLLPPTDVEQFKKMSFFNRLDKAFDGIKITNEENVYDEEVYWRLVRPPSSGGANDVGPLHADEWFWKISDTHIPSDKERIKIWISIFAEQGLNGFRFIPGSHKYDWNYSIVKKNRGIKPYFDETIVKEPITFLNSAPGEAILFHDRLLHGGFAGGEHTRVSIECTFLVNKN